MRKTISNSSTGLDEIDHDIANKSYSLTNMKDKSELPRTKQYYKRNLQNISEIHSNSETESQLNRKAMKPPISPYDRSRSHSSSKTLIGSKGDVRRHKNDDRGSSSELRSSKQELRDLKYVPIAFFIFRLYSNFFHLIFNDLEPKLRSILIFLGMSSNRAQCLSDSY